MLEKNPKIRISNIEIPNKFELLNFNNTSLLFYNIRAYKLFRI